jgi:hypothetical protein
MFGKVFSFSEIVFVCVWRQECIFVLEGRKSVFCCDANESLASNVTDVCAVVYSIRFLNERLGLCGRYLLRYPALLVRRLCSNSLCNARCTLHVCWGAGMFVMNY